jgi:hypothetical protein
MAVVGGLQDLLRVPRRIIVLYAAVALVSFACHLLLGLPRGELAVLAYVMWLLLHFSGAIYVIPPLSCVVYLVLLGASKIKSRNGAASIAKTG